MNPPLPRAPLLALAGCLLTVWPFSQGCSRTGHNSLQQGNAPTLQQDDAPLRSRGGTNPNAPYVVAASTQQPQLARRTEPVGTSIAGPCDSKDLSVTEIAAAMNGDFHAVKLAFYNQGLASCRIGGYPSVTLLDKKGNPVASVSVERVSESALSAKLTQGSVETAAAQAQTQMVIAPRSEAWFQMGWSTGEGCPEIARISVSAPGSSESFTVNHPLAICEGRIEITALHSDRAD